MRIRETGPGTDKLLKDIDHNKDGKISEGELAARISKIKKLELAQGKDELSADTIVNMDHDDGLSEEFKELDRDGDGKMTEKEVLASMQADDDHLVTTGDGEQPPGVDLELEKGFHQAASQAEMKRFAAADGNQDGHLTREEWTGFRHKPFPEVEKEMMPTWTKLEVRQALLDHDKDGNRELDRAEVEAAHDTLWYLTHPPHLSHDEL